MAKMQWASAVFGLIAGAVIVGVAWDVTNQATKSGPVVATVGTTKIHQKDFQQQLEKYSGSSTLQTMITQQLILDGAKKYNVTATSSDINNALQGLEAQYGITSQAQLEQELASSNMSLADLKSQLKVEVLAQKIAQAKVPVTDAQVQSFYSQNKTSFTTPSKVTLSGIVTKTQADAQTAAAKLKSGESFAAVAKTYSTDAASKNNGGAMGSFAKTDLDPALQSIAFSLPIGQASQPVQTAKGWEIVKVTAKSSAKLQPLTAKLKKQITTAIKSQSAESSQQLLAELAKTDKLSVAPQYQSVISQIENPAPSSSPTGP